MGGFNYDLIKKYINKDFKIAVETGTFLCDGTLKMAKYFDKIYTIDIDETIYQNAQEKLKEKKNIYCLLGNSSDVIKKLSENHKQDKLLFWLDAHWSGDKNVNWNLSSWKGPVIDTGYINGENNEKRDKIPENILQNPLGDEILNIYNCYSNETLIYIDDLDKFDKKTLRGKKDTCFKGEDWSHLDLKEILNLIKDRLVKFEFVSNDQAIIKLKANGK